ncbi:MAG: hypothetical protein JWM93_2379 [Frankiales bacterium]|nr:hypothetical protein [Frankiales bacterium]
MNTFFRGAAAATIAALTATVTACTVGATSSSSNPAGVIHGRLQVVGGAPPGLATGVSGFVVAAGSTAKASTTTGADGDWVVTLPAGTYIVSGDRGANEHGALPCQAMSSIELAGGSTASATVFCHQS